MIPGLTGQASLLPLSDRDTVIKNFLKELKGAQIRAVGPELIFGELFRHLVIALNYTRKVLDNDLSVVFYDLTTLYFETESEDDLRKTGFSKDGKFHKLLFPNRKLLTIISSSGRLRKLSEFPSISWNILCLNL